MKPARFRELRILPGEKNLPVVRSRFRFLYESPRRAGLDKLRKRYQLNKVVASAKNDWEEILSLRNWLSARWSHGFDNTTRGEEATGLDYLIRADAGESFTCAVFAFTLVELLTAFGIPARNLSLGKGESDFIGPYDEVGHCVCEAWSNFYRKWIVLDADCAAHFERKGRPLSALELRDAWLDGRWREIDFVRGPKVPALRFETYDGPADLLKNGMREFLRHNTIDFYENLIYVMGNCHAAKPPRTECVMWCDARRPQRLVRHNLAVPPGLYSLASCRQDVEYTLNHAFLRLHCRTGPSRTPSRILDVYPESETPWFSHYEARIEGKPWRKVGSPFPWKLREGDNTLAVRPVSTFGRAGTESAVTVRFRP